MPFTFALLVLAGAAYYFTTPLERARFVGAASRAVGQAARVASYLRLDTPSLDGGSQPAADIESADAGSPDAESPDEPRRAPPAVPLVTLALVALNLGVFLILMFAGALGDQESLVGWGANFGPRTTNGEWWRLAVAMFMHAGPLHLLVDVVALAQVGLLVERLIGRFGFAVVYLAAGLMSGLVTLFAHPATVSVGASGCVFGVYGLFLAILIASTRGRLIPAIPLMSVVLALPVFALFMFYSVSAGYDGAAEMTGLAVGCICGLVLTRNGADRTAPPLRVAATMAAVALVAVASAVPLRGLTDVRPEIARVAEVEQRTSHAYDDAVRQLTGGQISLKELAQVIDRTILPELRAAHDRVKKLGRVPRDHVSLMRAADEYFTLREKSWRVRADALRKTNKATMWQAEQAEQASLLALAKIAPPSSE